MTDREFRGLHNSDYQADFAQRLVKTLGFERAIRECYENQWLGTLIYVQQLKRHHRREA